MPSMAVKPRHNGSCACYPLGQYSGNGRRLVPKTHRIASELRQPGFSLILGLGRPLAGGTSPAPGMIIGGSPAANWTCLASSSSGANLIAAVGGGQIYTSPDYSTTWTAHGSVQNWTSVATSADGTKLVAVATGSQIYISNNSGNTWTAVGSNANWTSVASSADGAKLAAAAAGVVYTSVDSGTTWASGGVAGSVVACSADGSKLTVGTGNQISSMAFPDASGKPATTFGSVSGVQLSSVELIFVGNGRWQLLSHEGPLAFQ